MNHINTLVSASNRGKSFLLLLGIAWIIAGYSQAQVTYDKTTHGTWRSPSVVYGTDGYILASFNGSDRVSLPTYISSWSTTGSPYNLPDSDNVMNLQDPLSTSNRYLGVWYGSTYTITLTPNLTRDFILALYFNDSSNDRRNETISFSGTANVIDPQTIGYWSSAASYGLMPSDTSVFPDYPNTSGIPVHGVWMEYAIISAIASQNIVITVTNNAGPNAVLSAVAFGKIEPVPEPSTYLLLGLGGLVLAYRKLRRK